MITQEQFADLKQYIPESPMVKMVFADIHQGEEDFDDWDEVIQHLIKDTIGTDGNIESLFTLLELTYMNAHNEGALESVAYEESHDGQG